MIPDEHGGFNHARNGPLTPARGGALTQPILSRGTVSARWGLGFSPRTRVIVQPLTARPEVGFVRIGPYCNGPYYTTGPLWTSRPSRQTFSFFACGGIDSPVFQIASSSAVVIVGRRLKGVGCPPWSLPRSPRMGKLNGTRRRKGHTADGAMSTAGL